MSSYSDQDRDAGGRFAAGQTEETNIDLAGSSTPSSQDVMQSRGEELDRYVHHDEQIVRIAATGSPYLSREQISYLSDPVRQPPAVRLGVAMSPHAGAGDAVASDPSPTIRAFSRIHWNHRAGVESDPKAQLISRSLALEEPAR